MNYQKNKEFVEYYVENVLMDLLPMMKNVINESIIETKSYPYTVEYMNRKTGIIKIEYYIKIKDEKSPKYTDEEVKQIFFNHININEFDKFCKISYQNYEKIKLWFKMCGKGFFFGGEKQYFYEMFEDKYKQYFRDERRREQNLKRKLKKYIK